MPYHLSKENEQWLGNILVRLRQATSNTLLETATPKRLLYILRSAANANPTKYGWVKERFILKLQPDGVLCQLKKPEIKERTQIKERQDAQRDLVSIVNQLIAEKPDILEVKTTLSSDDMVRLETFCLAQGYSITDKDNTLTIQKKNA